MWTGNLLFFLPGMQLYRQVMDDRNTFHKKFNDKRKISLDGLETLCYIQFNDKH